MDELLEFKVAEANKTRESLRQNITRLNREIIDIENKLTKEHKEALYAQLKEKQSELLALESTKPQPVDDPNTSSEAQKSLEQLLKQ